MIPFAPAVMVIQNPNLHVNAFIYIHWSYVFTSNMGISCCHVWLYNAWLQGVERRTVERLYVGYMVHCGSAFLNMIRVHSPWRIGHMSLQYAFVGHQVGANSTPAGMVAKEN